MLNGGVVYAAEQISPETPTATPFMPGPDYYSRIAIPPEETALPLAGETAFVAPQQPSAVIEGIDFSDTTQKIQLLFHPPSALVNLGRPFSLQFQPGWPCQFKDDRACISLQPGISDQSWIVLTTIHSGVGGDAEVFRNAIEGSGVNAAFFPLDRIQRGLNELQDTPIRLEQGNLQTNDLQILAVTRIPASQVAQYYQGSALEGLRLAAGDNPAMAEAMQREGSLLVLETCGWRHPDERWAPGVSDTTGSIYLIAMGK